MGSIFCYQLHIFCTTKYNIRFELYVCRSNSALHGQKLNSTVNTKLHQNLLSSFAGETIEQTHDFLYEFCQKNL